MKKLTFNDFLLTLKTKIIHKLYTFSIIYKITPLSSQMKGWSTEQGEESALLVYLY